MLFEEKSRRVKVGGREAGSGDERDWFRITLFTKSRELVFIET
jgi:hypothetical protein